MAEIWIFRIVLIFLGLYYTFSFIAEIIVVASENTRKKIMDEDMKQHGNIRSAFDKFILNVGINDSFRHFIFSILIYAMIYFMWFKISAEDFEPEVKGNDTKIENVSTPVPDIEKL